MSLHTGLNFVTWLHLAAWEAGERGPPLGCQVPAENRGFVATEERADFEDSPQAAACSKIFGGMGVVSVVYSVSAPL